MGLGRFCSGRVASATATQSPFAIRGPPQRFLGAGQEPGLKYGNWTVGPEPILLGNVSSDEARFGGFVKYDLSRKKSLQANLATSTESATTIRGAAAAASMAARRRSSCTD
jgi:hypothetical protein